jgi:predicted nucleotidyltransferase
MTPQLDAELMLLMVARALGQQILDKVAFVGGCTTSLLVTDEFSKEDARYTDDVDLIIGVMSQIEWHKFERTLTHEKGFRHSIEDKVLCRLYLGELKVDFMPFDGSILGFTNCWYEKALATATPYNLKDEFTIRVLTPPLFIATKLEAYRGRGNNDPIGSKDVTDIIALFDGRLSLVDEIQQADRDIREYISVQLADLLQNSNFDYAVQGSTKSDKERENLIFQRIEDVIDNN